MDLFRLIMESDNGEKLINIASVFEIPNVCMLQIVHMIQESYLQEVKGLKVMPVTQNPMGFNVITAPYNNGDTETLA